MKSKIACVQIGDTIVQGDLVSHNYAYATVRVGGQTFTGALVGSQRKGEKVYE